MVGLGLLGDCEVYGPPAYYPDTYVEHEYYAPQYPYQPYGGGTYIYETAPAIQVMPGYEYHDRGYRHDAYRHGDQHHPHRSESYPQYQPSRQQPSQPHQYQPQLNYRDHQPQAPQGFQQQAPQFYGQPAPTSPQAQPNRQEDRHQDGQRQHGGQHHHQEGRD